MTREAVIIPAEAPELKVMQDPRRGELKYRLLIDAEGGPSEAICQGLFYLDDGQAESPHYHDIAETVHVIDGRGLAVVGDRRHEIGRGDTVFIPAGLAHGFEAPESMTILFTFPTPRFADVAYHDPEDA